MPLTEVDIMWLFTVPGAKLAIKVSVALAALLFIVQIARWALKSKARNPFSQTHWASATVSEDDTSSKLAEVHQSRLFDPKEVPSRIDAVVVGSDLSCLTTAAILAKTGRTVVVLEGEDKERGADTLDCLEMAQMGSPTSLCRILLDQITDTKVHWEPLEDQHHLVHVEKDDESYEFNSYPVHSDLATWKSSLLESFPKEKSGIDQFFKMVSGTSPRTLLVQYLLKRMPLTLVDWLASLGLFTLMGGDLVSGSAKLSTAASVSKMTKDPELRQILSYLWVYAGGTPTEASSMKMQALFHKHFEGGSFRPTTDGADSKEVVAAKVIPLIENTGGGRVFCGAPVQEILYDGRKAMGVTVSHADKNYHLISPVIISGHGVKRTFGKLLPKQVSDISRLEALCGRLRAVPSMIRLDIELTAPWRKLGIKSQNHMVFPDSEQGVMIFPRETTKIVAAVPLQVVLSDSGWEQEDIDPLGDRLFHTVCKILPAVEDNLKSRKCELVSEDILELSVERFSARNCSSLRPETDVSGLYLTGPDILTTGFCGRLLAGLMTAGAVLERHVLWDLVELRKELIKASSKAKSS